MNMHAGPKMGARAKIHDPDSLTFRGAREAASSRERARARRARSLTMAEDNRN